MDYKETLLMPQTDFEMRGKLNQKDPLFVKKQLKQMLYYQLSSREGKTFILHDGPPYANGDIHIGHALNKIIKDFIIRKAAIDGFKIDWRIGWDTHGLPIELKVKKTNNNINSISKLEYLEACKKYALEQVAKQEEQFMSLGILTDPQEKYLTLNPSFISSEIEVFFTMLNKNLIYQDLKPVFWSWSSSSALAEAEVEYGNKKDPSIYLGFKLDDLTLVIWTTTPWTIPGNVALAFGKDIEYVIVAKGKTKLVLAKSLISDLEQKWKVKLPIVKSFIVGDYLGQEAINPLNKKPSKLIIGHHITTESGTGIVHIAGGHGLDDYQLVKKEKLPLFVVMDDNGHTINSGPELNGLFYLKTNLAIIEKLTDNGLIFSEEITHSIPLDWRTKKPVIYRATKQWFVSIDKIKTSIIKNINKVEWIPAWGAKRLTTMTNNREDWCISRQRSWGVPIPIIYDENKVPIINKKLQQNIIELFLQQGISGWETVEIKDLLPEEIPFVFGMKKELDILDVWFDSGSSWKAVLPSKTQADIYFEGNDQYRGWFNSSLITATVLTQKPPYKKVITHGMVVDENGNKMSKSIGNTIDPLKITKKYGNDILRLWIASSNYQDNIKISIPLIEQISNDYRKIRNTIRFLLGNLNNYQEEKAHFSIIDEIIIDKLNHLATSLEKQYQDFNYVNVVKQLLAELGSGAIAYYLDYSKDILYVYEQNDPKRLAILHVFTLIQSIIFTYMGPIIPLTIEEAYESLTKDASTSFFLQPKTKFKTGDELNWLQFNEVREIINKEIELLREKKLVRSSQEVEIVLKLPKSKNIFGENLKEYLMLGKLIIEYDENISVIAKPFDGLKCQRCWKYFETNEINNDLCNHCQSVLSKK